jgi:predicted nucleic acid-binding protein
VVPDASSIVEFLLGTSRAEPMDRLLSESDTDLHVPGLCDVEVASVVRRLSRSGVLSDERQDQAVSDYVDLPLTRHGHLKLLARVLELGDNFSAYDGTYVALAEQLGADLLTADGRLRRAVVSLPTVKVI